MEFDSLRQEIDRIDSDIVRLLGDRARVATELGTLKIAEDLPIQDAERENAVVERAKSMNEGPLDDESLAAIYRRIIDACTKAQERKQDYEDV